MTNHAAPNGIKTTSRKSVPLLFRIAGVFWIGYGGWILVYGWFYPSDWGIVNVGPPMVCMGYGASLLNMWRSAVWLGWLILLFLVLGAMVTGLAIYGPFIAVAALQAVLALYTTVTARAFSRER